MNPIRKLRYAWFTSFAKTRNDNRDLRARVQDQMQALWNRNELIADQDDEITRLRKQLTSVQTNNAQLVEQCTELRGENRTLQQDVTTLRNALEACGRERDHLLGKAANP